MKLFQKISLLAFFALAFAACIDELNVDTEIEKQLLVVEGAITTEPGPHRVLLSKSAKYGSIFDGLIEKETGATVWVRDEASGQVFFTETSPGTYATPAEFSAEVGRKYTLFITLANGERYVSIPEAVVEVPPIDTLTFLPKELPTLNEGARNSGVEIYARWQDPEDVQNFYLWEAEGIYILNTSPELHTSRDGQGTPIPDPLDCCARCYVYETGVNSILRIFKDNLTNGSENTELTVFIPDDGKRFMEKYMVAIRQSSLTKEAFQFYNVLKNQLSIQGNIFDPPPATIRGNMINLDNPDEAVIGYFRASDVQTDTLFILRSEVDAPQPLPQINDDCRVFRNTTTTKPPFWR